MINIDALALEGARLELRKILTLFPALRRELLGRRSFDDGSITPEDTNTNTCDFCERSYTPRTAKQRTCGRDECKKAYKSVYMKAYFAKRKKALYND